MQLLELLAIAALAVVTAVLLIRRSAATAHRSNGVASAPPVGLSPPAVPDRTEVQALIKALPGLVVLLDSYGSVVYASPGTARLNIVRRGAVAFDEVAAAAKESLDRRDVVVRELSLRRPPLRKGLIELRVRAIPVPGRQVLLLIDDMTEEHRVANVRRDFIANVSHELKTPVGAISLLAEALMTASDDPVTVQHFAERMHAEAGRLANLINDVIDLSRLQGEDPLAGAEPVRVDALVAEAVDHVRAAAEAKSIEIFVGGTRDLVVVGMADQLVTAVRNLLTNAVSYSPEHTRVAVAVRLRLSTVEIAVKDQGLGIEESEQSRIFERFYRVDSARSRVTGGTGLGLAIVRNVCRNHGGDVSVWSVVGEGSTFTIELPAHRAEDRSDAGDAPQQTDPNQSSPTDGSTR